MNVPTTGIVSRIDLGAFAERVSREPSGILTVDLRNPSPVLLARARAILDELDFLEAAERDAARAALADANLLSVIDAAVGKRRSDAIGPDYIDLWFLYRCIREQRPAHALEFGSGLSTYVIAKALKDNGTGHLLSIDSMEEWAKETVDAMPGFLRDWCHVLYAPAVETEWGDTLVFRHDVTIEGAVDFVYLDGPPLTAERMVAVDPLVIEDRLTPNALIVVDGRLENVRFLQKNLKNDYSIQSDALCFDTERGKRIAANYMTTFLRIA